MNTDDKARLKEIQNMVDRFSPDNPVETKFYDAFLFLLTQLHVCDLDRENTRLITHREYAAHDELLTELVILLYNTSLPFHMGVEHKLNQKEWNWRRPGRGAYKLGRKYAAYVKDSLRTPLV